MRILVVDDSRAMRMIIERTLVLAGYDSHEIVHAGDAAEAARLMAEAPPDLILCDWNMPGTSGLDFLAAIRAAGWSVPFGFVTSEASPAMREKALAAGALFLIAKPFTPHDFQEALDPVLA
ncbi:MAG: response regulator [Acidothermus sp.]|nr:response regulator [Acidothermus sp.]MCL6537073.1 response regulator [Acidothermus sp.]